MANLNLFTHPGTFRRMEPEYLITWLTPAREYLAKHGFVLPDAAFSQPSPGDVAPTSRSSGRGTAD